MVLAKPRNPQLYLFSRLLFCISHAITHFIHQFYCKYYRKNLRQIQLYMALIGELMIIFTDQMSRH
jgi:hypothetical protein